MKRILYLDHLKGFAILLVILGHLYFMYAPDSLVFSFLTCFHVPVFMFVSGFLARKKGNETFVHYVLKRTKAILLPYLFFCVIYAYLDGIDSAYAYFFGFTRGGLWFLPTIWALNIIHFVIISLNPITAKYWISIIVVEFILIAFRYMFSVEVSNAFLIRHLSTYWLIFELGYIWGYFKISLNDWQGGVAMLIFLVGWSGIILYGISDNILSRMVLRFSSTIAIVYFFQKNESSKNNRLFSFLGTQTLAIYILHYRFLGELGDDFGNLFSDSMLLQLIFYIFISSFIAVTCVLLKNFLSKNKYFRLLFGE